MGRTSSLRALLLCGFFGTWLVFGACDPCDAIDKEASLELGTGSNVYIPIEEGQSLAYVRGIQGGSHLEAALRIENLYFPEDAFLAEDKLPRVSLTLHDENDELVGGYQDEPRSFVDIAPGRGQLLGEEARFVTDGADFIGATLRMAAGVTDMCGNSASAERRVVVTGDAFEG